MHRSQETLAELRLSVRFGVHLFYFTNTSVRLADSDDEYPPPADESVLNHHLQACARGQAATGGEARYRRAAHLAARGLTGRTVTSRSLLIRQLDEIRAQDVATQVGELREESACAAVPVRSSAGSLVGAIAMSGPRRPGPAAGAAGPDAAGSTPAGFSPLLASKRAPIFSAARTQSVESIQGSLDDARGRPVSIKSNCNPRKRASIKVASAAASGPAISGAENTVRDQARPSSGSSTRRTRCHLRTGGRRRVRTAAELACSRNWPGRAHTVLASRRRNRAARARSRQAVDEICTDVLDHREHWSSLDEVSSRSRESRRGLGATRRRNSSASPLSRTYSAAPSR